MTQFCSRCGCDVSQNHTANTADCPVCNGVEWNASRSGRQQSQGQQRWPRWVYGGIAVLILNAYNVWFR